MVGMSAPTLPAFPEQPQGNSLSCDQVTCWERGEKGEGNRRPPLLGVTTSLRIASTKRFQNPGRRVAGGRLGPIMAIMSRPRRGLPKAARHSNSTSWFAQANSSQRSQSSSVIVRANNWNSIRHVFQIPSSTYHHPHVTSPCLGARGEGFIGGAGKGVSQASGAAKSNWSVSESVERPIRTREIHRIAPPRSETRISPKGGKQIPVTSFAP
ncbi:uncharacterized protein K444DRAFT_110689 [Hyaloscypha bicolor E]|uniref:Uncharacterized protein n=1 Tax=Hyaloscypha bicolor E TaxID=1095630 RepID=A0A2J6SV76_9HELO|nr:uncharacterized protein K444DRAFT_110689 [Hyaloscypha bicolor E]PMD54676.1 hypothetical protein K444DRAFT_110689 [Hyaloscypha bicolor E]